VVQKIGSIQGSAKVREHLIAIYAKPLWEWALPLTAAPPDSIADDVFKSVLRTRCRWWCKGRWWAQRVHVHPRFGAHLTAAKRAADPKLTWSTFLDNAMEKLLLRCGFGFGGRSAENGIQIVLPDDIDPRILQGSERVRNGQDHFWSNTEEAMHVLRSACRVQLLNTIRFSRHDSEGYKRIDIEASSCKPWQKFLKACTPECLQALNIWMGGAVTTQTRRQSMRAPGTPNELCMWCNAEDPSARHLWAHCPKFAESRAKMSSVHGLEELWWGLQPRTTAKTGWITLDAAQTTERRSALQAAACAVGIAIVQCMGEALLH
jgi:hypothetical protein